MAGLAKVVVLLAVIWWMYDAYTYLTNALAGDAVRHRLLLIGGMGGFLIMALAIPTTFEGGGAALGAGYLAVIALHGGLFIRATSAAEADVMRGVLPFNLVAGAARARRWDRGRRRPVGPVRGGRASSCGRVRSSIPSRDCVSSPGTSSSATTWS